MWNDVGGVQAGPGPISLSSAANQVLTYGFFFIGNNSTVGTVAPGVMSIDQTPNANFISFLDGFAANNSTTIGRSLNDGLAKPLNLVNGWQIADTSVSAAPSPSRNKPPTTARTSLAASISTSAARAASRRSRARKSSSKSTSPAPAASS